MTTEYLLKAYPQIITLKKETEQKVLELSRALLLLWNAGVWLGLQWLRIEPEVQTFIPTFKRTAKNVTAFSFNYWLAAARKENWTFMINGQAVCIADISSDASREVLKKLAGSFQSYFNLRKRKDSRARLPNVKPTKWFQTISWTVGSVHEENGMPTAVVVPGMNGARIVLPLGKYQSGMLTGKRIVHFTLSRTRDGKYQLSVVTASGLPEPNQKAVLIRAIDLGSGNIAVSDSDGSEYLIPTRRPDKYWRREIKVVEERITSCTKNSRSYRRRMDARRAMFEKMEAQHRDHQRKLASALASSEVKCIVVGKMRTRLGLARSEAGTSDQHWGVQNTGYANRLLVFLKEKARERGIRVVELADPKREGELTDPEVKFIASRALLLTHLAALTLPVPASFRRKKLTVPQ